MDYPALEKKRKNGPITVQDMVDFYAEYIQCDALGKYDQMLALYFESEYKDYAGFQNRAVYPVSVLKNLNQQSLY